MCSVMNLRVHNAIVQVFREINRLASEGKWDSINNAPKLFLRGEAKLDAYRTWSKINKVR